MTNMKIDKTYTIFFASSGNDDDTKIMIFTVCYDKLVKIHTHIFREAYHKGFTPDMVIIRS